MDMNLQNLQIKDVRIQELTGGKCMSREEVFERLNKVFRDVFDNDDIVVVDATTAKDIEDWDSLMHITLVSEVEDEFAIHFEMKDVTKMQNVGEMADKILEMV